MNNGNVGIGTANPLTRFHINGGSQYITNTSSDSISLWFQNSINWAGLGMDDDGSLRFTGSNSLSNNPHMVITDSGNVGIGISTPVANGLQINKPESTLYNNSTPNIFDCLLSLKNIQTTESTNNQAQIQFTVNGGSQNRVGSIGFIAEDDSNRKSAFVVCTDDASYRLEKFRITGDGNVGIGTTSPLSKLHILASDYNALVLSNTVSDGISRGAGLMGARKTNANVPFTGFCTWDNGLVRQLYLGGGGWGRPDATQIVFYTAPVYSESNHQGSVRMVILPSGNVGIGTSSPTSKLQVAGSIQGTSIVATTGMEAPYYTTTSTAKIKRNIKSLDGEELTKFTRKEEPVIRTYQFDPEAFKPKLEQFEDITRETEEETIVIESAEDQYKKALAEWEKKKDSIHFTRLRKGFIVEELPEEFISDDGRGWDVTSFIVRHEETMQDLTKQIEQLKSRDKEKDAIIADLLERVKKLESR